MSLLALRPEPESITRIAAAWALQEQQGLSKRQRSRRDAWLASDPEHEKAYRAALKALMELDRHAANPEIMALRQAALARIEQPPRSRMVAGWAACAIAILSAGAIAWLLREHSTVPLAAAYTTSVGERSTVPLTDGSVIVLNTASEVQVAYQTEERAVRLLNGQALFTVAHGQPTPFRVYAGDKIVTAVGTEFDVRVEDAKVTVSVVEGSVRVERVAHKASVSTGAHVAEAETLIAGEALVDQLDGSMSVKQVDVERIASWRSGLLSFQDTPLAEAVAEVNRYTHRPVTLADPALAAYRVSGTFRVGEPERFAQAMRQLFPVSVTSSSSGTVIEPQ